MKKQFLGNLLSAQLGQRQGIDHGKVADKDPQLKLRQNQYTFVSRQGLLKPRFCLIVNVTKKINNLKLG